MASASSIPPQLYAAELGRLFDTVKKRDSIDRGLELAQKPAAEGLQGRPVAALNGELLGLSGRVLSSNGSEAYVVSVGIDVALKPRTLRGASCSCPAAAKRKGPCKHAIALAVWYIQERDHFDLGSGAGNGLSPSANSLAVPRSPSLNAQTTLGQSPSPSRRLTPPPDGSRGSGTSPRKAAEIVPFGTPLPTQCFCGLPPGKPLEIKKADSPNVGKLFLGCPRFRTKDKDKKCGFFVLVERFAGELTAPEASRKLPDTLPLPLPTGSGEHTPPDSQPVVTVMTAAPDPSFSAKVVRPAATRKRKAMFESDPEPGPEEKEEEAPKRGKRVKKKEVEPEPEVEEEPAPKRRTRKAEPAPSEPSEPGDEGSEAPRRSTRARKSKPEPKPSKPRTPRASKKRGESMEPLPTDHSLETTAVGHTEVETAGGRTQPMDIDAAPIAPPVQEPVKAADPMPVDDIPVVSVTLQANPSPTPLLDPITPAKSPASASSRKSKGALDFLDEVLDDDLPPPSKSTSSSAAKGTKPQVPTSKTFDALLAELDSQPTVPVPPAPKLRERTPEIDRIPETQYSDKAPTGILNNLSLNRDNMQVDSPLPAAPEAQESDSIPAPDAQESTVSIDSPGSQDTDITTKEPVKIVRKTPVKASGVVPTVKGKEKEKEEPAKAPKPAKEAKEPVKVDKGKHKAPEVMLTEATGANSDDDDEGRDRRRERSVSPGSKRKLPGWMTDEKPEKGRKRSTTSKAPKTPESPAKKKSNKIAVEPSQDESEDPSMIFRDPFEKKDGTEGEEEESPDVFKAPLPIMTTQESIPRPELRESQRVDTVEGLIDLYNFDSAK
jgi:hypothetical protein